MSDPIKIDFRHISMALGVLAADNPELEEMFTELASSSNFAEIFADALNLVLKEGWVEGVEGEAFGNA